jgi:hypothetical protein
MRQTTFMKASDKAHSHLLRGLDMAMEAHSRVPLGHNPVDPRTMEAHRNLTNIGVQGGGNPASLPMDSRKVYDKPRKLEAVKKADQSEKTKKAGVVVDPTAIESGAGADPTTVDTISGYGITGLPFMNNS